MGDEDRSAYSVPTVVCRRGKQLPADSPRSVSDELQEPQQILGNSHDGSSDDGGSGCFCFLLVGLASLLMGGLTGHYVHWDDLFGHDEE